MATDIKGQTIASTYQDLVKRDSGTYAQAGMNIEIQNDSGTALATGLYLESGATTDHVGIGLFLIMAMSVLGLLHHVIYLM